MRKNIKRSEILGSAIQFLEAKCQTAQELAQEYGIKSPLLTDDCLYRVISAKDAEILEFLDTAHFDVEFKAGEVEMSLCGNLHFEKIVFENITIYGIPKTFYGADGLVTMLVSMIDNGYAAAYRYYGDEKQEGFS